MSRTLESKVQLDHERLDVYDAAVALDGVVVALARKAGRGHGWLCDQASCASASVVLNLAEALGREAARGQGTHRAGGGDADGPAEPRRTVSSRGWPEMGPTIPLRIPA